MTGNIAAQRALRMALIHRLLIAIHQEGLKRDDAHLVEFGELKKIITSIYFPLLAVAEFAVPAFEPQDSVANFLDHQIRMAISANCNEGIMFRARMSKDAYFFSMDFAKHADARLAPLPSERMDAVGKAAEETAKAYYDAEVETAYVQSLKSHRYERTLART